MVHDRASGVSYRRIRYPLVHRHRLLWILLDLHYHDGFVYWRYNLAISVGIRVALLLIYSINSR